MKILLYTQIRGPVGSLRLLLNLARHLQQYHQTCLAFDRGGAGEDFLQYFPDIPAIDCSQARDFSHDCDVLLCHLPHRIDSIVDMPVPRKLAVSMEVAAAHNLLIGNDNAHLFDAVLHLHDEQIATFSRSLRAEKCIRMPLINNIESAPDYVKTGNIGCIGTKAKHDTDLLLQVRSRTAASRKMKIWAPRPLTITTKDSSLCHMGVDPDIYSIQKQYDLLLHTPGWSNGTSTVISDALASGKMVLLSPLPAFKQAYGGMPGIYFLDDPHMDIENLLQNYDKNRYEWIRDGYAAIYNRDVALQQWQRAIEGAS